METSNHDTISAYGPARSTIKGTPLSAEELEKIDSYWRASLYLWLGVLCLGNNPLLREPLKPEHVKPRLLGHWGSDAGQSFTYIHIDRLINRGPLHVNQAGGLQLSLLPVADPPTDLSPPGAAPLLPIHLGS
jgi:xylulose-5-phosphate/fructose-6-phosphate phosphoketolase